MDRCAVLAITGVAAMTAIAAASTEPVAELQASYSLAETSLLLNLAYVSHGGSALMGSALYGIKVYRVTYSPGLVGSGSPGADRDGTLSGLVVLPTRPMSTLTTAAFLHGTTTLVSGVPSTAFSGCGNSGNAAANASAGYSLCIPDTDKGPAAVAGALVAASMGYLAIVPDGLGYGTSGGTAPSYLIAEAYAIATFNLHAAAVLLVPTLGRSGVGTDLVVAGYSEGGYGALAVHRESYRSEWADVGVTVVASFPSAGPYDLELELASVVSGTETPSRPAYIVYLGYSYWTALGIANIFDSSYVATVQSWFDGSNNGQAIDSYIQNTLGDAFLAVFDTGVLAAVRSGESSEFTTALSQNSLVGGWEPKSMIRLCHGTADEVVAPANSHRLLAAVESAGGDVALQTYGSDACSSHTDCGAQCLEHTMMQMWEYEGKWSGALQNDRGIATSAVIATGVAAVIVIAIAVVAWRRCRNRNDYEMIA